MGKRQSEKDAAVFEWSSVVAQLHITIKIGESRFIATLKEQEESFEQQQEWEKTISVEEKVSGHHSTPKSGLITAVSHIKKLFKI